MSTRTGPHGAATPPMSSVACLTIGASSAGGYGPASADPCHSLPYARVVCLASKVST
jgi:hypothetical protein